MKLLILVYEIIDYSLVYGKILCGAFFLQGWREATSDCDVQPREHAGPSRDQHSHALRQGD